MTDYKPGKCNIGHKEQKRRYLIGSTGVLTAVIYIFLSTAGKAPIKSDLLLFILFFIGFNGLIQGKVKFCAGYGLLSRENTGDDQDTEKVSRNSKDLLESLRIQLYSLFAAVVATALTNAFLL